MSKPLNLGELSAFIGLAFDMVSIPLELTGPDKRWCHCLPPTDHIPEARLRRFMPYRATLGCCEEWERARMHRDPDGYAAACVRLIPEELRGELRTGTDAVVILPYGTTAEESIRSALHDNFPRSTFWKLCGDCVPYGTQFGLQDFLERVYGTDRGTALAAHVVNYRGSYLQPVLVKI